MAVRSFLPGTLLLITVSVPLAFVLSDEPSAPAAAPISYYKQIRPIFQANCQGCHQPNSKSGDLDLTSYGAFQQGGKRGPAYKAGAPAESLVVRYLTGESKPQMPLGQPALKNEEIDLFRAWIKEGAKDDTPAGALDTDPAMRPLAHIFVASKAPWFEITDAIPQIAEAPPPPRAAR